MDRARYCPGRPQLVATKSSGADVYLFDVGSLDEQDEPEEVRALEPAGHAARAGHGQVCWLA